MFLFLMQRYFAPADKKNTATLTGNGISSRGRNGLTEKMNKNLTIKL